MGPSHQQSLRDRALAVRHARCPAWSTIREHEHKMKWVIRHIQIGHIVDLAAAQIHSYVAAAALHMRQHHST